MGFTSGTVLLMALSASVYCLLDLPDCKENDFHYEYTECKNDIRWRVSVPEPGKCSGGSPSAPVQAKQCSFSCKPGEFLDISRQECIECQAGTYSIGGGARFDQWDKLPDGFTVKTETYSFWSEDDKKNNCSSSEWKPYGSYIGVRPAECGSTLIYPARLVEPGTLTFLYQHVSHQIAYIHFTAQNDQCQAAEEVNGKWLSGSDDGKWETVTVDLKSGLNVLSWKALSIDNEMENAQQAEPVVLIKKIEISGVAYTSECSKCKNGTYSSAGAHSCTPCPINTYSGHGASQCSPCDPATEFSDLGDSVCRKKSPCTEQDYFMVQTPCDEKEKTRIVYKWIEPRICRSDIEGAVQLPPDRDISTCPSCSPGMYRTNRTCEFCPLNHYSDGINECKPCTVNTSPDYEYNYRSFTTLLPNMTSECVTMNDKDCSNESGWLPFGDHLQSHFGRNENGYIILQLKITGFRTASGPSEGKTVSVGEVTFEFETSGASYCQLLFIVAEDRDIQSVIKKWEGTNMKQSYVYQVTRNTSLSLIWAFQNAAWMSTDTNSQINLGAVAKIYSIKVTNTMKGGAEKCQTCPKGTTQDGCIPCPDGHYIDPDVMKCIRCPPNTVVHSKSSYGVSSCKPCGPGLIASKGSMCVSDCTFTDSLGRAYDLRNLTSFHLIEGGHLFTSRGTQFYRAFNLSLCGDPEKIYVSCKDNFTSSTEENHYERGFKPSKIESVKSMICKMTMVPAQGLANTIMTTQSTSIGDHLTKVVWNQTDKNLTDLYTKAGFSTQGTENDIQFYYAANTPTLACPNGRTTIVSLHCDMKQEGLGILSPPPKCPDGTCDGCTFHFLWTTQSACPICRQMDYEKIVGECVGGKQTIHYYPPKNCTVKDTNQKMQVEQTCTVELRSLPFMFQIAIPVILGLALILCIMLFVIWRRNRKLEYRYMKLVESSGGKDGELPSVDSCALEEDEEDDQLDTVKISKGASFFRNFTKRSAKDQDNPFESMQLQAKTPLM